MFKTLLLRTALLMPLALPSCSTDRQVPVAAPRVPCQVVDPGPVPAALSAKPEADGTVGMSLSDAQDIWIWMRDARRAIDAGQACSAGGV